MYRPDHADDWTPAAPDTLRNAGIAQRSSAPAVAFVVGMVLLIAALVAAMIVLWPEGSSENHNATVQQPQSVEPLPSPPSRTTKPKPSLAGVDGGPGPVTGGNFGPGDNPYVIADFAGIPFAFGLPDGWGCIAGSRRIQADGVAVCRDERAGSGRGAGGWVGFVMCADACTPTDLERVGTQLVVPTDSWMQSDPMTTYADVSGEMDGAAAVRVAMRRVFTPVGGRPSSAIAFAQLTGGPEYHERMFKVLNSIHANTQ